MTVQQIDMAPGGPSVSRVALGLWRIASWDLSNEELLSLLHAALHLGITTFDHADIYGDYQAEKLFGRALALEPSLRDSMQIITKCDVKLVSEHRPAHRSHHYDTSREHILASVDNSLHALRTDHVDVLLLHRPDPLMDADEVAEAFNALRQAGKVLHFGVSNFFPRHFELLASRLDYPLVTNQVELSVMEMGVLHDGTVDQCQMLGISPMAWSPLARGRLFSAESPKAERLRAALQATGKELGGATIDQVALAWILRHPARIVPIVGSGKLERIRRAAAAADLELSRHQWFTIWTASTGTEVP
ncbi:MAG TPA: aldo/keto reductase [Anaerolineae bacterium]|nr:aldo/keto reductase [Anaerolineae bacterium]